MSRITQQRLVDGELITASDLNSRFGEFSQAGALNAFNLRDAAVDLPQLQTGWQATELASATIGKYNLLHTAPVVVASTAVAPGTAHPIEDGAGNPTPLSFGLAGASLTSGDILRVYWDLSVYATWSGAPWNAAGSIGAWSIPDGTPGGAGVASGISCWVAWLQWNTTDPTLATGWVEVPGQSDFQDVFSGVYTGAALPDTAATTVIPMWVGRAYGADDGVISVPPITKRIGWRGVSGTWYYLPIAPVTVYGVRVVVQGIYHAFIAAGQNLLIVDPPQSGAAQTLEYTSGELRAIIHRQR